MLLNQEQTSGPSKNPALKEGDGKKDIVSRGDGGILGVAVVWFAEIGSWPPCAMSPLC